MKDNMVYICIGENFVDGVEIGDCGCVKTLIGWLTYLFPNVSRDKLQEYFDGDSNSEVIAYILKNKGKRLKRYERE
mgnify:CR=1 FL=1